MLIERTSPKMLSNVVVIRPILIVLLVFYHAFLIFQGGWGSTGQFPEVKAYWWLDKLSYSFLLEMFVFISGYVLGYQVRVKGESILSAVVSAHSPEKSLSFPQPARRMSERAHRRAPTDNLFIAFMQFFCWGMFLFPKTKLLL